MSQNGESSYYGGGGSNSNILTMISNLVRVPNQPAKVEVTSPRNVSVTTNKVRVNTTTTVARKNKYFSNKGPKPGTITQVRGAKYQLPISYLDEEPKKEESSRGIILEANKADEKLSLNVDELKLQEQIQSISRKNSSSPVSPQLMPLRTKTPHINASTSPKATPSTAQTTPQKHFTSRNSNLEMGIDEDYNITASKLERFRSLLAQPDVDIDELRKLSWSGIPSEVRPLVWKILVGYIPCNGSRRTLTHERRRKEYLALVSKYYDETQMKKTEYENSIQRQIHIDVPRTNPDVQLFQNETIQAGLERILYIWSIRHPASGYVQGINDLVTPFLVVFLHSELKRDILKEVGEIPQDVANIVEGDAFWCFSLFLDFIQDHYTFAQPGIQRMIHKLEEIIQKIDEPLYNHVQSQGLQFIQFAFRWMNCLLMRELNLKLIIRLFDAYLAEGQHFEQLHIYVCASFLKTFSEELLKLDFTEMVIFIQHLPTQDWTAREIEMLLSQAYMLKELYDSSPSHL
jgi:hypothetical protein